MIGDDLVNDVGGAQRCGIKGVQVRTGKYRLVNVPSSHSHALLKLIYYIGNDSTSKIVMIIYLFEMKSDNGTKVKIQLVVRRGRPRTIIRVSSRRSLEPNASMVPQDFIG